MKLLDWFFATFHSIANKAHKVAWHTFLTSIFIAIPSVSAASTDARCTCSLGDVESRPLLGITRVRECQPDLICRPSVERHREDTVMFVGQEIEEELEAPGSWGEWWLYIPPFESDPDGQGYLIGPVDVISR